MLPEVDWLGFHLNQTGIVPLKDKLDGLFNLKQPKTLKQVRGLMGSAHQLCKFIPHLASICYPFRTLLKKGERLKWDSRLQKALIALSENAHFTTGAPTRITCDASHTGRGAVLEQQLARGSVPIASRFLAESRYSTNELELLPVVWSVENFRNYILGYHFTLRTDHRALLTALKNNRCNKTAFSCLSRWVDRLVPFSLEVQHLAGKNMGWADYLSRSPSGKAPLFRATTPLFLLQYAAKFVLCLHSALISHTSVLANRPIRTHVVVPAFARSCTLTRVSVRFPSTQFAHFHSHIQITRVFHLFVCKCLSHCAVCFLGVRPRLPRFLFLTLQPDSILLTAVLWLWPSYNRSTSCRPPHFRRGRDDWPHSRGRSLLPRADSFSHCCRHGAHWHHRPPRYSSP